MKFTIAEHSTEGELLDITTIQNVGWLQVTRKYYPF